jgi:two-component system phosphate regulon response regulator PhoB
MGTPRTILVVDDDKLARVVVTDALSAAGYRVVEASDGKEALDAIDAQPLDLVVLDLLMPNLSGMDVLAHVRERHPRLRVLVLSSLDEPSLIEEAKRNGATEFLAKPFHPLEVLSGVQKLLEA